MLCIFAVSKCFCIALAQDSLCDLVLLHTVLELDLLSVIVIKEIAVQSPADVRCLWKPLRSAYDSESYNCLWRKFAAALSTSSLATKLEVHAALLSVK